MDEKHPQLKIPKLLILAAIAYYAWQHKKLRDQGTLSGPPWRVSVNPKMLAGAVVPVLGIEDPELAMRAQNVLSNFVSKIQGEE